MENKIGNSTLDVETDVVLIGGKEIKADGNTIYEITLTDTKSYSVVFVLERDSFSFQIVLELPESFDSRGYPVTESVYMHHLNKSIVSCIETDREIRSD